MATSKKSGKRTDEIRLQQHTKELDGWQRLAIAIVRQAVEDYADAFLRIILMDDHPEWVESGVFWPDEMWRCHETVQGFLKWIETDGFGNLCDMSREAILQCGDELIAKRKKRAESTCRRKYKRISSGEAVKRTALNSIEGDVPYLEIGSGRGEDNEKDNHHVSFWYG